MIEWLETNLNDVIEITGGGTPKTTISEYWDGDIPWLSVVDFNTGLKHVRTTEKSITEAGLNKSSTKILQKGDIIISARGTVGAISVLRKQMAFNQSCYGLRGISNKADTDFIYYLTYHSINKLQQIAHGGVFDTITRETFKAIDIHLPPLPEQKAIASVLSSLDDKIDLLHRQNKTLEAMAETLFRQWFVEEADYEKISILADFAFNIKSSVKKEELLDHTNYVGLEHIPRKNIALSSWGDTSELASNKLAFLKGDILFGKLRSYFHKVVFASIDGICSTDVLVIRPKRIEWFPFCLFWFYSKEVVDHSDLGSEGTRMPRTNWNIVSNYEIPTPEVSKIYDFNEIVIPMLKKITHNCNQIKNIEKLRDTILPKLMSGEVRVEV